MTRPSTARKPAFRCAECGTAVPRWVGRCPECQAWGSIGETGPVARAAVVPGAVTRPARPIGQLDPEQARAQRTGVGELDRVLGGGLVPGSVILLAGEPGIGKSTLLLDVAHRFAEAHGRPALIVTGEESTAQVRLRAERTGSLHPELYLAAENDLAAVLTHVDTVGPGLLVVDSVQTISSESCDGAAGGVPQIRAVTAALIGVAKTRGLATVLVGHVTKDGGIAGPRVLEHLVDVVLHFEGDRHSSLRLIRATKNRYGAVDEVGCFEMREDGLAGLPDPSGLFLSERSTAVAGTCVTVTLEGKRPMVTEIQALTTPGHGGSPRRAVSSLDSSRVAMLLAVLMRHDDKVRYGDQDVYAATVGGIAAHEPAADLAVALALASAGRDAPIAPTLCAIGEVSLAGDVRRVPALDRRLAEAARLGFTAALVPASSVGEVVSPVVAGMRTIPVATIDDAITEALALSGHLGLGARRVLRPVPPSGERGGARTGRSAAQGGRRSLDSS
ncbi:MAG: DNA repair protein RadA [Jatrophihabitans sp.]|uniref:DNA repair protein RadA n=1 Tax=Jatrophihabitans sp. TaxID=1932789 RepID=UPI003F810BCA